MAWAVAAIAATVPQVLAASIHVDDYGAAGDGMNWDHAAIQRALDAAGEGGTIAFGAGKTYVACAELRPLQGQTILGNGAVLKRCDAVTTRLSSDAKAGSTEISVDRPEIFETGQSITPVKGRGGYKDGEYVVRHILTATRGKTLKFTEGLLQPYPAGSTVTVKFNQIQAPGGESAFTIDGLILDGNRDNNQVYQSWTDNMGIYGRANMIVRNCEFRDQPGTAVTATGTNVRIENNRFFNLDGPFVHFSSTRPKNGSTVTVRGNTVYRTNRRHLRMKHSQGVVTISSDNYAIDILDNVVEDAPVPFIANFHHGMGQWRVRGNRVTGTNGVFAGKLKKNDRTPLADIVFEENEFHDVGTSRIFRKWLAEPVSRFRFDRNIVKGGSLELKGLKDSSVKDNTVMGCRAVPIVVADDSNVAVSGNQTRDTYCKVYVDLDRQQAGAAANGKDATRELVVTNLSGAGETSSQRITIRSVEAKIARARLRLSCKRDLPAAIGPGGALRCRLLKDDLSVERPLRWYLAEMLGWRERALEVSIMATLEHGRAAVFHRSIALD